MITRYYPDKDYKYTHFENDPPRQCFICLKTGEKFSCRYGERIPDKLNEIRKHHNGGSHEGKN